MATVTTTTTCISRWEVEAPAETFIKTFNAGQDFLPGVFLFLNSSLANPSHDEKAGDGCGL